MPGLPVFVRLGLMIGSPATLATTTGPSVFVIGNVYKLWNCISLPLLPWK